MAYWWSICFACMMGSDLWFNLWQLPLKGSGRRWWKRLHLRPWRAAASLTWQYWPDRRRRVVFIPYFSPPYGSLKATYNRLLFLSPQQTPCEVREAEKALKSCDWPQVTQLAACGGGVRNLNRFSRLESTILNHYTKLALNLHINSKSKSYDLFS